MKNASFWVINSKTFAGKNYLKKRGGGRGLVKKIIEMHNIYPCDNMHINTAPLPLLTYRHDKAHSS